MILSQKLRRVTTAAVIAAMPFLVLAPFQAQAESLRPVHQVRQTIISYDITVSCTWTQGKGTVCTTTVK